MGTMFCKLANRLLTPLGLVALKTKRFHQIISERDHFAALYRSRCQQKQLRKDGLSCITFSRDRAIQLHALLVSYFDKFSPAAPLQVIFQATSPGHREAYDDLRSIFAGREVTFISQESPTSFRQDLISALERIETKKLFFLVDDIIFTGRIDSRDWAKFDTDRFIPTLRLGLNLKRCYTLQQEQPLPPMLSGLISDGDKIVWDWKEGKADWGYPLSVDGNLFASAEILAMTRLVSFSAPNSYEEALQEFRPVFQERRGIAFRKSRIVNVPCNKVQVENRNICGTLHQDLLLAKWQEGLCIDVEKLYGIENTSAHEEIPLSFVKRKIP